MGAPVTGGGFLDRWSRRKRAAETAPAGAEAAGVDAAQAARAALPGAEGGGAPEPEAAAKTAPAAAPEAGVEAGVEAGAEPAAEPSDEAADAALLASLPKIEDITAATDIRVFLQKGVPAALRNAALRRAWTADPYIGRYEDPARDYFWDWNAPGGVPGGGGTLDPERVARMVRDIAGKDESQTQDSDAAEAEAPAPVPADPGPAAAPADRDAEGHETVIAATGTPAAAPEPARAAAPARGPEENALRDGVSRRRHGGAMPG